MVNCAQFAGMVAAVATTSFAAAETGSVAGLPPRRQLRVSFALARASLQLCLSYAQSHHTSTHRILLLSLRADGLARARAGAAGASRPRAAAPRAQAVTDGALATDSGSGSTAARLLPRRPLPTTSGGTRRQRSGGTVAHPRRAPASRGRAVEVEANLARAAVARMAGGTGAINGMEGNGE